MISVLYNIILITNFKLIEMCIKSSPLGEGRGGASRATRTRRPCTPLCGRRSPREQYLCGYPSSTLQ